jgi:hypothetical protein
LGGPVRQQNRESGRRAGDGKKRLFEVIDALPAGESGVASGEVGRQVVQAAPEESLEVHGPAFLGGPVGEGVIGLSGLGRHPSEAGCIQVQHVAHESRSSDPILPGRVGAIQ